MQLINRSTTTQAPRTARLAGLALFMLAALTAGSTLIRSAAAQSTAGVVTYAGADHNIWRIGADGGDRRQLTQDGMSDTPVWVAGGRQIAFQSIRAGRVITVAEGTLTLNQIYLMGSDGSAAAQLSDGSSDDKFPEATADGSRIVFVRNHNWRVQNGNPVRDTEIGSMRLDGSDYRVYGRQVTDARLRIDRYPARLSPDGSKIVLVRKAPGKSDTLQVLDVANGAFMTLTLDADRSATDGTVEYLWPRFDPQGHIVVLRRSYTYGPVEVALISLDVTGQNARNLISAMPFEALANGFDVNWAARTVIGARAPQLPGGLNPEEIYLYNLADGSSSAPLDSGHAPSFIPFAAAPLPTVAPSATVPPSATRDPNAPSPTAAPVKPLIDTPDPLFYNVWERVDRPVKENVAVRSWIWGPQGRAVAQEPYGAGSRLVQYFDKARMELNPAGSKPAFVTNGLLVVELMSGRVQTGPTQYETRSPAVVPIGGDGANNPAPSYATLARISSLSGENRAVAAPKQLVTASLSNTGARGTITFPATESLSYYAPETGHNIPDVFFNFLNQTGKVYSDGSYHDGTILDWVFTVGYPISEPVWTRMTIAGQPRNVMVQAFQRQILTYIPDYGPPWNVQFGNVGVAYYGWRYGHAP